MTAVAGGEISTRSPLRISGKNRKTQAEQASS
jgi:hypothetical protein